MSNDDKVHPDGTPGADAAFGSCGIEVNPGSGPVGDGNELDAWINVVTLLRDAGVLEVLDMPSAVRRGEMDDDGRMSFTVVHGDRECEIDMPGIPLLLVRYMREPGQNIWDYPRLYVDGSSWVWAFAIEEVRYALTPTPEQTG